MNDIIAFKGENRWLSNFYPCVVLLDGVEYPSTENAYQAAKTLDTRKREMFQDVSPGQAKKLGKNVKIRSDWESVKIKVMNELLIQKFAQPQFKARLNSTGDSEIIEGNTWGDVFWGVCNGTGENHLGRIIMEIRSNLKHDIDEDK